MRSMVVEWLIHASESSGGELVATPEEHLDIGNYDIVCSYVEVLQADNAADPDLMLQHCIVQAQDADWADCLSAGISCQERVGVMRCFREDSNDLPLSRWLRWKLNGSGGQPYAVTARVTLLLKSSCSQA